MATGAEFAAAAQELIDKHIPYARNGSSLAGMDCQGLMEYCLREVGMSKNWTGSNAMYRDMLWVGTPEECTKVFGEIPVGAWLYIWADDGGEVARGYKDGLGNASHVGVYTGEGLGAIHASRSLGKVAESKFTGKTIPNGGWNRVGLCALLEYSVNGHQLKLIEQEEEVTQVTQSMSVTAASGSTVKMRAKPSTSCNLYWDVPIGSVVEAGEISGEWMAISWNGRKGYMKTEFLMPMSTDAEESITSDMIEASIPLSELLEKISLMETRMDNLEMALANLQGGLG